MPSPTLQMKIPAARAGQLKALAARRGTTAMGALEHLLNLAIEDGEIPDTLPGYEVVREGGVVVLTLDGQRIPGFAASMAHGIAAEIEAAGRRTMNGKVARRFYGADGSPLDIVHMLTIGPVGAGVGIVHTVAPASGKFEDGERVAAGMTHGMAVDLARQIRAAVAH